MSDKKNIIIWESTSQIAGGTKVSIAIYDLLKNEYNCRFFIPAQGPVAQELKRLGIDYTVIDIGTYNPSRKSLKDILKFLCYFPGVFIQLFRYFKKNRVDLIYSNTIQAAVFTATIGNLFSSAVIWHIHHYFNDYKARFVINLFGKFKSIKKIVFVSDFVQKQFPSLAGKSSLIYNGIDIAKIRENSNSPPFEKPVSLPKDKKLISIITHITATKNQETLIKAIPLILKKCSNVHFLIVGKTTDTAYHQHLRDLIRQLGISEYVTFTGYCNNVPGLLKDIYVNVITSVEGCPMILLESLAMAVPSVIPDMGACKEIAKEGRCSLVYKYFDENSLAEKISLYLNDKTLYENNKKYCLTDVQTLNISVFNEMIKKIVNDALDYK